MDSRADVKDIASIERFAASLLQQRGELALVLEAVRAELDRLSDHLESRAPDYWRTQGRRAAERLSEARATLGRCEQTTREEDRRPCDLERKAVAVAKRRFDECEQRLRDVKLLAAQWRQQQGHVESQLRQVAEYNDAGIAEACRALDQILTTLRKYAEQG